MGNRSSKPKSKEELLIWVYSYGLGVKEHGDPIKWDVTNICDENNHILNDAEHKFFFSNYLRAIQYPEIAGDFSSCDGIEVLTVGGCWKGRSRLNDVDINLGVLAFDEDGKMLVSTRINNRHYILCIRIYYILTSLGLFFSRLTILSLPFCSFFFCCAHFSMYRIILATAEQ